MSVNKVFEPIRNLGILCCMYLSSGKNTIGDQRGLLNEAYPLEFNQFIA